jgi:hypothetical protein
MGFFGFLMSMSFVPHLCVYATPSSSAIRGKTGLGQAVVQEGSSTFGGLTPQLVSIVLSNLSEAFFESRDFSLLSLSAKGINDEVCVYRCQKPVQLIGMAGLGATDVERAEKVRKGFNRALKMVKTLIVDQDVLGCLEKNSLSDLPCLTELTLIFSEVEFKLKNNSCIYTTMCGKFPYSLKKIVLSLGSSQYATLIGWILRRLPPSLQDLSLIYGDYNDRWKGDALDVNLGSSLIKELMSNLTYLPSSVSSCSLLVKKNGIFSGLAAVKFFINQIALLPKNLKCLSLGFSCLKPSHSEVFLEGLSTSGLQFNQFFDSLREIDLRIEVIKSARTLRRLADFFPNLDCKSVKVIKLTVYWMDFANNEGEAEELGSFFRGFSALPQSVEELHLSLNNWHKTIGPSFNWPSILADNFRYIFHSGLRRIVLEIADSNLSDSDFTCFWKSLALLPADLDALEIKFPISNSVSRKVCTSVGVLDFIGHLSELPKKLRCFKMYLRGNNDPQLVEIIKGSDMSRALQEIPHSLEELEIGLLFRNKTVITKDNLQEKIDGFELLKDHYFVL